MKKLLAIILSITILFAACGFSAGAVNYPSTAKIFDEPLLDIYEENGGTVYAFTEENGVLRKFYFLCSAENPDGSAFTMLVNYKGAVYAGDSLQYSVVGSFVLLSRQTFDPGAYYIVADGKFAEITEAYRLGLFDAEVLYAQLSKTEPISDCWDKDRLMFLLGDVNSDGIVSVSDATAVQSYVAGNTKKIGNRILADTNGDGVISVTDATAVQKKTALMSAKFGYGRSNVIPELIKVQ